MQGPRRKYGDSASFIAGGQAFIEISRPVQYILMCIVEVYVTRPD
jgi:hypothetical protein